MFGGATGDTGKYSITGETFSFDIATSTWSKVESKKKKLFSKLYFKFKFENSKFMYILN